MDEKMSSSSMRTRRTPSKTDLPPCPTGLCLDIGLSTTRVPFLVGPIVQVIGWGT